MANSLDYLAKTILNKTLDDCSVEELQNLANRYPYFAPVQFLYLKKLDPLSEAFTKQYQKAALFYKTPEQFDYFFNKEKYETVLTPLAVEERKVTIENNSEPVVETEHITPSSKSSFAALSAPVAENAITFEPFHTVDYFASQGIKLSQEDASKDKFGKQVKSFTEWLKTMKRLPATQLNTIQGPAEKQVENLAAHSVQTSDVVTEAMAEVWVHQGNKAKAKEVYRKLSLLNPSKSAYFASKIELLNDSN